MKSKHEIEIEADDFLTKMNPKDLCVFCEEGLPDDKSWLSAFFRKNPHEWGKFRMRQIVWLADNLEAVDFRS
jgi:hypothetical protein